MSNNSMIQEKGGAVKSELDQQLIGQLSGGPEAVNQVLVPIVQSLLASSRLRDFGASLRHAIDANHQALYKLCQQHYADYCRVVPDYEALKADIQAVHASVKSAREQLKEKGRLFLNTLNDQATKLQFQLDVTEAAQAGDQALQAANVAQEAHLAIMDKRYEEAIVKLDQLASKVGPLQHSTHGPLVKMSHLLIDWMHAHLQDMRNAATNDLKTWLSTVRDVSGLIGKTLLAQCRSRLDALHRLSPEERRRTPLASNAELYLRVVRDASTYTLPELDCSELMRVSHLFALMGRSADFDRIYVDNRRLQVNVIIESPLVAGKDLTGQNFQRLLEQLLGFLQVELTIRRLGLVCVGDGSLQEWWATACSRLAALEQDYARAVELNIATNKEGAAALLNANLATLMSVKWSHVFFAVCVRTLCSSSAWTILDTAVLDDALLALFYKYVDLLKTEHMERVQQLLATGRGTDFGSAELTHIADTFLSNFQGFLDDLAWPGELAVKAIDAILGDAVINHWRQIGGSTLTLSDWVDLFAKGCQLERYLRIRGVGRMAPAKLRTYRRDVLHEHIVVQVKSKLDLCMRNAAIDFCPRDNQVIPSPLPLFAQLQALLLQDVFATLKPIFGPAKGDDDNVRDDGDDGEEDKIASLIVFEIGQHLAERLMGLLLSERYKMTTVFFLKAFKHDLTMLLDTLAGKLHDLADLGTLWGPHFGELEQTLDLVTETDRCHDFLDPTIRKRSYGHVQPSNLRILLTRIKEPDSRRRSFEDLALLLQ